MSKEEQVGIRDETSDRKYFTMVPNLIDDLELSPFAVRLYLRIKRRCGEGNEGVCWETTRNLAEGCQMGAGTVVKAKKELEEAGLIQIEAYKPRYGNFSGHRMRIVDIWGQNEAHFSNKGSINEEKGDSVSP